MKLNNEDIAQAVEEIQNFFERADVSTRDRTKINLLVEEALLRCSEHFGAEKDFELKMNKWFGAPKVLIRIRGEAFNPLDTPEDYDDEIITASVMQNLLQYESAETTYTYRDGYNEIRIFSTKERKPIKIPGGNITRGDSSCVRGGICRGTASAKCARLKTLMALIFAVTIPTIFISVVSSI